MDVMAAINYGQSTGVETRSGFPKDFQISAAYPNPFNPSISVDITVAVDGHLIVEVLDISGRMISKLYDGYIVHSINKLNWVPNGVPAGIYFIKATLNGWSYIQKVTLLK